MGRTDRVGEAWWDGRAEEAAGVEYPGAVSGGARYVDGGVLQRAAGLCGGGTWVAGQPQRERTGDVGSRERGSGEVLNRVETSKYRDVGGAVTRLRTARGDQVDRGLLGIQRDLPVDGGCPYPDHLRVGGGPVRAVGGGRAVVAGRGDHDLPRGRDPVESGGLGSRAGTTERHVDQSDVGHVDDRIESGNDVRGVQAAVMAAEADRPDDGGLVHARDLQGIVASGGDHPGDRGAMIAHRRALPGGDLTAGGTVKARADTASDVGPERIDALIEHRDLDGIRRDIAPTGLELELIDRPRGRLGVIKRLDGARLGVLYSQHTRHVFQVAEQLIVDSFDDQRPDVGSDRCHAQAEVRHSTLDRSQLFGFHHQLRLGEEHQRAFRGERRIDLVGIGQHVEQLATSERRDREVVLERKLGRDTVDDEVAHGPSSVRARADRSEPVVEQEPAVGVLQLERSIHLVVAVHVLHDDVVLAELRIQKVLVHQEHQDLVVSPLKAPICAGAPGPADLGSLIIELEQTVDVAVRRISACIEVLLHDGGGRGSRHSVRRGPERLIAPRYQLRSNLLPRPILSGPRCALGSRAAHRRWLRRRRRSRQRQRCDDHDRYNPPQHSNPRWPVARLRCHRPAKSKAGLSSHPRTKRSAWLCAPAESSQPSVTSTPSRPC